MASKGKEERRPTNEEVQAIADAACASTHSVWKRIAGAPVRGKVATRIDEAIAAWRAKGGGT